jgi:hypothetical protein
MKIRNYVALSILVAVVGGFAWLSRSAVAVTPLSPKQFANPELAVSTATVPLQDAMDRLPNSAAWGNFLARQTGGAAAYIDPRSGTPASILASVPLIPGTGKGNTLTLADLGLSLGSPVTEISAEVVATVVRGYVLNNLDVLAVAADQLGPVQAAQVTDSLWHVSIPQEAGGVRVRDARLAGALNHGNLVLLGTEMWGNVQIDTRPTITGDDAISIGFAYAGGRLPEDAMWKEPLLELVPYAPAGREIAYQPGGPIGQGYGHRLVWSFGFVRPSEEGRWEVLVDAHTGEIIAFRNVIQDATGRVKGGVYPGTDTEVCPSSDWRCGIMQSAYPMPWADTGLPSAPYANSAGLFDYTSGAVSTTLNGSYYKVTTPGCGRCSNQPATSCKVDTDCPSGGVCTFLSETVLSGGELDLGGANGQHRCQSSGASAGNVPAARTAYYAANKIAEIARGWLPNNGWLRTIAPNQFLIKAIMPIQIRCRIDDPTICDDVSGCNAYYDSSPPPPDQPHIRFLAGKINLRDPMQPWICRPFGEISSIVEHEWGHALDDNDRPGTIGNGDPSNPGEAYADIAAMYREQASCIGYGVWGTASSADQGCDTTSDMTGYNQKLDQDDLQPLHCFDNCNGLREADYAKHLIMTVPPTPGGPDTAQNFVCQRCLPPSLGDPGPCGKEPHCEAAALVDQAAWDLAARDLRGAPFYYGSTTAFIIASRLFYLGSGNVGSWYSCDCGAGTSSGCGVGSGYLEWLAADDDDGFILGGTPHATALAAAFERHNIGCPGLIPGNSGCSSGPTSPLLTSVIKSPSGVDLSWTSVTGASGYWVFRTEGHADCNLGKALIAQPGDTSYHDAEVAPGRRYFYTVMAVGYPNLCFSPDSGCMMPDQVASSEQMYTGTIAAGSHLDVRTSNNVREQLTEALLGGVSRLSHVWRFEGVPILPTIPSTTLKLYLEGYRPANSEGDNFQFAYSVNEGSTWSNISGAVIKSPLEPTGISYVIGQPVHTGTILIRVEDTNQASGSQLDSVFIDRLVLRIE